MSATEIFFWLLWTESLLIAQMIFVPLFSFLNELNERLLWDVRCVSDQQIFIDKRRSTWGMSGQHTINCCIVLWSESGSVIDLLHRPTFIIPARDMRSPGARDCFICARSELIFHIEELVYTLQHMCFTTWGWLHTLFWCTK